MTSSRFAIEASGCEVRPRDSRASAAAWSWPRPPSMRMSEGRVCGSFEAFPAGAKASESFGSPRCGLLVSASIMSCAVPTGLRNEFVGFLFPTLKRGANKLRASGAFVLCASGAFVLCASGAFVLCASGALPGVTLTPCGTLIPSRRRR